jgi:hypothetical protein
MRFDLRLHGKTPDGRKCQADVSVYADGQEQLQQEAKRAAESAAWRHVDAGEEWVAEGSHITVENIEWLRDDKKKRKG